MFHNCRIGSTFAKFLGWATSVHSTSAETVVPVTEDTAVITTYYAVWQAETYTITYEGVSGNGILNATSPNSYTYGTAVTVPDATGSSCTFAGWYTDAEFTDAFTGITATTNGNLTLYAKFTATLTIYKEKFESGWGDLVDTKNITCGKTASAPSPLPTKTGSSLSGWQTGPDGEETSFIFGSTTVTSNMTIWGVWVTNSITYHNVGTGSGYKGHMSSSAATSYNAGTAFTLPTPIMDDTDYIFDGWYESSSLSGSKVTSISATETGPKNYYAKFLFDASYINCDVEDFSDIEFASTLTSITWEVESGSDLSAIVSAIASKEISVNLDLSNCSISSIGAGAFSSISSYLMGLTIPSSVNSIGAGAFNGCSSLASLTDNGDGEWLVISQRAVVMNLADFLTIFLL